MLPTAVLTWWYLAAFTRLTRASMLEESGKPYLMTARMKGVREGRVFYRHALRNAAKPVLTMLGLQLGTMLAGAVMTEVVFAWPGMGLVVRGLVLGPDAISPDELAPPSAKHWMGSDYLGRDVFARVLHGVNTSLLVGAAVAVTATAIGLVLGTLAGYRGGWIDHVIMRVADALLIIPTFFLVLSIAFVFGGTLTSVIVLLGVTLWPPIARIVRAEVLTLKEEAFVLSARALGVSDT